MQLLEQVQIKIKLINKKIIRSRGADAKSTTS